MSMLNSPAGGFSPPTSPVHPAAAAAAAAAPADPSHPPPLLPAPGSSALLAQRLQHLRACSRPASRRKREMTPADLKDATYWVKRRRNNEAARRSRERRRRCDLMLEGRLLALSQENAQLRAHVFGLQCIDGGLRAAPPPPSAPGWSSSPGPVHAALTAAGIRMGTPGCPLLATDRVPSLASANVDVGLRPVGSSEAGAELQGLIWAHGGASAVSHVLGSWLLHPPSPNVLPWPGSYRPLHPAPPLYPAPPVYVPQRQSQGVDLRSRLMHLSPDGHFY